MTTSEDLQLTNRPLSHNAHARYEVIATDEYFAFVCEYAPKGDLLEHIRENGRLKGKEAKRICAQLIAALAYCHEQGVVHRDLKLENVLLDVHGNAKLADWGFGRFFSVDSSSRIKEWCGSPPYAAPEIFLGRPYIGPSIDIWSLGVVFYGIVTGKLPFDSDTFDGVCSKVISGGFSVPFFMALECESLIRGMLCKSMSRRLTLPKIMMHGWLEYDQCHQSLGPAYKPQRDRPRPRHQFFVSPSMASFNGGELGDNVATPPSTPPQARRVGKNGKPIRRPRANTCIGQVQPGGLSDTTGRRNRTTPPKAGAHLTQLSRTDSTATASPNTRPRPKSTTPETEESKSKKKAKEEESLRSQPLKKKGLSPSTARFIEASKRLFARLIGGDRNALTPDPDGDAALAEAERVASRFSLPARMEDVEDRAPLIPVAVVPSEPKFRFPCVECHAPESARWNFPTQSPTKCADCRLLELPRLSAAAAGADADGGAGAAAGAANAAGSAAAAAAVDNGGGGAALDDDAAAAEAGTPSAGETLQQEEEESIKPVTPASKPKEVVPRVAGKHQTTKATTTDAAADGLVGDAAGLARSEKAVVDASPVTREEETPEKSSLREPKALKPPSMASAAATALATVEALRRKASPPKMANLEDVVAKPLLPANPI